LTEGQLHALGTDRETKTWIDSWRRRQAAAAERTARVATAKAPPRLAAAPRDTLKAPRPFAAGADLHTWLKENAARSAPVSLVRVLIEVLSEEHRALEQRIAALEAKPKGLAYVGVWRDDQTYMENDCVTRAGSLWICKVNHCRAVPGTDGGGGMWVLAVKRGTP
jgi:hypothetical protein